MDLKTLAALGEAFDPKLIKHRQGVGRTLDYVEAPHIIRRLNQVLEGNWSFLLLGAPIILNQTDGNPAWVVVHGRLVIHGREGFPTITKDAWGSRDIGYFGKQSQKAGQIMALGDEIKKAATDALKKCATQCGVALDLYKGEDYDEEGGATSAQAEAAPQGGAAAAAPAGQPPVVGMEAHSHAVNAIAGMALDACGKNRQVAAELIATAWANLNSRGQVARPAEVGPAWRNLDILSMRALYAEVRRIIQARAAGAIPAGVEPTQPAAAAQPAAAQPAAAAPAAAAQPAAAAPAAAAPAAAAPAAAAPAAAAPAAAAPAAAAPAAAQPAAAAQPGSGGGQPHQELGPQEAVVPREPTGNTGQTGAPETTAGGSQIQPPPGAAQAGALKEALAPVAPTPAADVAARRRADALKGELLSRIKRRCAGDQSKANGVFAQAWANAHAAGRAPAPSEQAYAALTYQEIQTIGEFAKPLLIG